MTNVFEAKVDEFGRLLIPKRLRDHLGITPGTAITLKEMGEENILLQIKHDKPVLEIVDSVLVFQGNVATDIEESVDEIRNERLHKLMGDIK